MIEFARTTDYAAVKSILTDKRCFHRIVNDSCPPLDQFEPEGMERFTAVLAREDGEAVGIFLLADGTKPGFCEVHFCFVPAVWGRTIAIGRAFVAWVWEYTSLVCLRGPIPSYNRLALELAQECGFSRYGVVPEAGLKNRKRFDLILTEARRP